MGDIEDNVRKKVFIGGSLRTIQHKPALVGPYAVTEAAFALVLNLKKNIHLLRDDYTFEEARAFVHSIGLVADIEELVRMDKKPVAVADVQSMNWRANVGTAAEMSAYFAEHPDPAGRNCAVVGVGRGQDMHRLHLNMQQRYKFGHLDTFDLQSGVPTPIRDMRTRYGWNGQDFCEIDMGVNPPAVGRRYHLIVVNMCLHTICRTTQRLTTFMHWIRRSLSPGGRVIGTYPQASAAPQFANVDDFMYLGGSGPTPNCEWGMASVTVGGVRWVDAVLPLDDLSTVCLGTGLALHHYNVNETSVFMRKFIPNRMSNYRTYPALAYFQTFMLKHEYETPLLIPRGPITMQVMDVVSNHPLELESIEHSCNFGIPLTLTDSIYLLTVPYLIKEKSDGVAGVIASRDSRTWLWTRGGKWRRLSARTAIDFTVMVEIIGDFSSGSLDDCRLVLSDPLDIGSAHMDRKPFIYRLGAFDRMQHCDPVLAQIDSSGWRDMTLENFEYMWEHCQEGIWFQPKAALAVNYQSGSEQRGSGRYLKRQPTIDLEEGQVVTVRMGGRLIVENFAQVEYPGVSEFAVCADGLHFIRARPDKKSGNSAHYIGYLNNLMSAETARILLVYETRLHEFHQVPIDLPVDLTTMTPAQMALLLVAPAGQVVDPKGDVKRTRELRFAQAILRRKLSTGTIEESVLEALRTYPGQADNQAFPNVLQSLPSFTPPNFARGSTSWVPIMPDGLSQSTDDTESMTDADFYNLTEVSDADLPETPELSAEELDVLELRRYFD